MSENPILKFRTFFLGKVLGAERDEYFALLWSFAYFFCILCSYFVLRPVREQMAVASGTATIPTLFLGTFIAMLVVTPVFGFIASRFSRGVFLPWIYLFFISNILIFWFVFQQAKITGNDTIWLARAFFIWISVFNMFVVSVFWSFMADIYTREQGRRLFGVISAGGSIGGIVGGIITSILVVRIGNENLFPIAAAILSLSVLCIFRLRKWDMSTHHSDKRKLEERGRPLGGNPLSGITHAFSSRYFLSIVTISLVASLLGTGLYMITAELVGDEIPNSNRQTQFFSNINIAINSFAFIGQMFIVRHVVGRFGISIALAVLPSLLIASYLLLAAYPTLAIIAFITFATRAARFSFAKPASDMLYSVVTTEEKYKTKNFIDTAVYRFGDVFGAQAIKLLLPLGLTSVSLLMLPFGVAWLVLSLWLGNAYRQRARELRDSGIQ